MYAGPTHNIFFQGMGKFIPGDSLLQSTGLPGDEYRGQKKINHGCVHREKFLPDT